MQVEELLKRYANGERNFSGANLSNANLEQANLTGINLNEANLSNANLVDFTQANLRNAKSFQVSPRSHDQGTIFEDTVMPDGTLATRYWV